MSRGTRITPLRLSPEILAQIDEAILSANAVRVEEPYDRTSWIKHAIREKLAKLRRSRSKKLRGTHSGIEKVGAECQKPIATNSE